MQTDLGGPLGYGPVALPRDDDGSHLRDLAAVFPGGLRLGGQVWSALWVNTNGTLSFGAPLEGYSAAAIAAAPGPVIAVFAADVDTRLRGEGLESGQIWVHEAPGSLTLTWAEVGFFRRNTDLVNSFQVQITAAGGQDADVSLRYGAIEWVSGDLDGGTGGLGGTPALAGIRAAGPFQPLPPSGDEAAWLALPAGAAWQIALRDGTAQILGPGGDGSDGGDPGGPGSGSGPGDGSDEGPGNEGSGNEGSGGATISGTILARDGSPLPGVTLHLTTPGSPDSGVAGAAVTDAVGAFAFTLSSDPGQAGGTEAVLTALPPPGAQVGILDVLALFRLVAGAIPAGAYSDAARLAADYTGDGAINIFDVLALFRHVVGVPGAPEPRLLLITPEALAAGFGPDPLQVPPAAGLPGIDPLDFADGPPLTLVAILSGDVFG